MDDSHRDCREPILRCGGAAPFFRTLALIAACALTAGDGMAGDAGGCEFDSIDPQGAEVLGAWNGMTRQYGQGFALLDTYDPAAPSEDTIHVPLNNPAPALARVCNGHMSNTLTMDVSLLPGDAPTKVYLDSLGCVDLIAAKVTVAVARCPLCVDLQLPKYSSRVVCRNPDVQAPPARTISALYGLRQTKELDGSSSQPWVVASTRFSLPLDEVNHPILVGARRVRMELCLDTEWLTTVEVHGKRDGPPVASEGLVTGCKVVEGRQIWLRPRRQAIGQLNTVTVPNRYGPPIVVPFPSNVPSIDVNAGRYIRGRYRILEIRPD